MCVHMCMRVHNLVFLHKYYTDFNTMDLLEDDIKTQNSKTEKK